MPGSVLVYVYIFGLQLFSLFDIFIKKAIYGLCIIKER